MRLNPEPHARPPVFTDPAHDLAGWVARLRDAEIPILRNTAESLELWRAREDDADARSLGRMIAEDPLMTLKLLAYAGRHRSPKATGEAETVTAVLVHLGIGPFFREFGVQPTVESWLLDEPVALDGLRGVLRRADRASRFALGFAVHRHEPDAAVIHQAALLHDFAEMLLWCHAPALMKMVLQRQTDDPLLRSRDAQRATLHVELPALQHALMSDWRLPKLLVDIADDHRARFPNVRCVVLGTRLARHTASDWHNPALADDLRDIGDLLNISSSHVLGLVHELDA